MSSLEAAPQNLQSQTSWVLFLARANLHPLQIDGLTQNITFRDSKRTIECYIRAQQFYLRIFQLFINLVRVFERGVGGWVETLPTDRVVFFEMQCAI